MENARYVARNGLCKTEIEADSVSVITDGGTEVELAFRRSDGEISLSVNGRMAIVPVASNVVRVSRIGGRLPVGAGGEE